jgi:glycosyltransferase involved in cell wall biosynthesis
LRPPKLSVRIAVVNLTAGGMSGGYRKYLEMVLPLVAEDPAVSSVHVFVPAGVPLRLSGTRLTIGRPFEPRRRGVPAGLAREVLATNPDVVFVPTARVFAAGRVPRVVMVRNMEPLAAPFGGNTAAEAVRNLLRAREARRACARAARVIAVSRYVKEFIAGGWRLDPDRIGVVYHGVEPPAPSAHPPQGLVAALAGRPFVFTAGSIRPARGLEDLIDAFSRPEARARPEVLVIAGSPPAPGDRYERRLRDTAHRREIESRVVWAGTLPREQMSWCYSQCAAFVMTSRVEACPNVALEAMSHGCLCISVDRAPMPEFFAAAALYYSAGDAGALAAHLRRVVDGTASGASREAARTRAASFDWKRTAADTVSELRRAAAS